MKLPLNYQSFIKKYYFEHKTLKEISVMESRHYCTIRSRKKSSISLLKEAINGKLRYEFCGIVGRTMRTTICANKIKLKILSYKDDIDFDKELTPFLTKQELFILRYYLNSKIAYSQKEMNEKGNFSTTINNIVAKIISKIKQTIKLKEKRNLICMQRRGEKSVNHFPQYLDERYRVELAEKMSTKREDVIIKLNTKPSGVYEMNKLNNNKVENLLVFEDITQIPCGQYSK